MLRRGEELDTRVNCTFQSMDFVSWQLDSFSKLTTARMTIFDALDMLDGVQVRTCFPRLCQNLPAVSGVT
jgi:hypothetical protein